QWRQHLEEEFATRFSPETSGVLNAALLGNRYNVSNAVADRLRSGGTFHILVIAGLHVGLVAGGAFVLARWLIRRRPLQFLFAVSLVWIYALAVGAQQPVMRAAWMFSIAMFGPMVARRANSLNAIGAAALLLLLWRSEDIFDPAFQLTFMSV